MKILLALGAMVVLAVGQAQAQAQEPETSFEHCNSFTGIVG